jgi:hypothetical protein
MSWYAHWITFGGVMLVQIHQNQRACELIEVASTSIGLLIKP